MPRPRPPQPLLFAARDSRRFVDRLSTAELSAAAQAACTVPWARRALEDAGAGDVVHIGIYGLRSSHPSVRWPAACLRVRRWAQNGWQKDRWVCLLIYLDESGEVAVNVLPDREKPELPRLRESGGGSRVSGTRC